MSTDLKPTKLLMVTADNNNKLYNMTPKGSVFLAEWGRVGYGLSSKEYPISKWHSTYNEKVKKGYKDVTSFVKTSVNKSGFKALDDPRVESLFNTLLGFSRTSVQANYTVTSENVSAAQVKEAQTFVDQLTKKASSRLNVTELNKLLLDLYTVIPRKMANVKNHLLTDTSVSQDLNAIIDNEQKTLDVMAGQVSMQSATLTTTDAPSQTILDALGITVEVGDAADEAIVRRMMGTDAREFRAVYRVNHAITRNRYTAFLNAATDKKVDLFWHGSRNENWVSILHNGLLIRPSNAILTGAMFGNGIYYADKYRKSAGYTSLTGSHWVRGQSPTAYLALMDVHLGRQKHIERHKNEHKNLNHTKMKAEGYDSVFAKGGYDLFNNEYITYLVDQSTIKYLVEVGK